MLKNPVFSCSYNPLSTIFNFSQFHEHFQKPPFADVLQNRCPKKVGNILNQKEFPKHVFYYWNIAKLLRVVFLQNSSGGCFYVILKVINQLFRKGYF